MTRAAVLLDVDAVEFIEPSFERLADDSYTRTFLTMPAKEGKLLISMDEYPLAVALNDGIDTHRHARDAAGDDRHATDVHRRHTECAEDRGESIFHPGRWCHSR